jgi:hypothetical protein
LQSAPTFAPCTTGHRSFAEGLPLCRESNIGLSAKIGSRQRILCRELDSRYKQNLAKASPSQTAHLHRHLCREPAVRLSAKKISLPRASAKALDKLFFLIFGPNFFVQPCYITRSQDLKFGVFSIPLAIFRVFFIFLIFCTRRTFELQVHQIMNLRDSINDIHSSEGISTPYPRTYAKTPPSRAHDMATKLREI